MLQIVFLIPENQVTKLQRFAYDYEARKNIIKEMINSNPDDASVMDGATFQRYHEAFIKSSTDFEIAKGEIERLFVPEELKTTGLVTWNLDYSLAQITINYHGTKYNIDNYHTLNYGHVGDSLTAANVADSSASCGCGGACK